MDAERPDVDALVARLQARVEERRRQGAYPPGLEDRLADQACLLLHRRVHHPRPVDVHGPLDRVLAALPLSADRIPPGAGRGHRSPLARLVSAPVDRHTEAILDMLQAFADPVSRSLAALAQSVDDLAAEVRALRPPLRAVIERQAEMERRSAR